MNTTFFFFNDTATTEIYTLSLHDALPICHVGAGGQGQAQHHLDPVGERKGPAHQLQLEREHIGGEVDEHQDGDRKSTRLNSSHLVISYAVFCLKKKNLLRLYCRITLILAL